jgi:hypothetical protein
MVKARKMRGGMVAAAGGAMLLLSGCGGASSPLADALAPCPGIAILADAADLTRFRPGAGEDLTAMVLTASLSSYQAKCDYARRGSGLDVTLTPSFLAERGPAATGRTADMQYMVAVVEGDRILSRAVYGLRVEFPPNVTRSFGKGEEITIQLGGTPVEAARRRVLLGFVLSPEELAANRLRGPR